MSTGIPSRPRQIGSRRSFAIVASQYNSEYVNGLVDHARRELEAISPSFTVSTYEVPGAFEIPLVVQEVAARGNLDAVIALGVIIEGQTQHAALIATAVTQSLQQISLAQRVPVIHEVLLVQNEEQARARCLDEEINRGTEAARAAARMVQTMSSLRASR
jgi:6,7-dimethyl-8-ribityllumazine synthase